MSPDKFRQVQSQLGWTNVRMAAYLRKTEQSVSNYRNARQSIPEHVSILLEHALETRRADAQPANVA